MIVSSCRNQRAKGAAGVVAVQPRVAAGHERLRDRALAGGRQAHHHHDLAFARDRLLPVLRGLAEAKCAPRGKVLVQPFALVVGQREPRGAADRRPSRREWPGIGTTFGERLAIQASTISNGVAWCEAAMAASVASLRVAGGLWHRRAAGTPAAEGRARRSTRRRRSAGCRRSTGSARPERPDFSDSSSLPRSVRP